MDPEREELSDDDEQQSDIDDLEDDDDVDDDLDDDDTPAEVEAEQEKPSEELFRKAQAAKARRLFIEEHSRPPHSASELHFFVMSSDVERPIEPEDCDFDKARVQN